MEVSFYVAYIAALNSKVVVTSNVVSPMANKIAGDSSRTASSIFAAAFCIKHSQPDETEGKTRNGISDAEVTRRRHDHQHEI
jgi:hypothetical protein